MRDDLAQILFPSFPQKQLEQDLWSYVLCMYSNTDQSQDFFFLAELFMWNCYQPLTLSSANLACISLFIYQTRHAIRHVKYNNNHYNRSNKSNTSMKYEEYLHQQIVISFVICSEWRMNKQLWQNTMSLERYLRTRIYPRYNTAALLEAGCTVSQLGKFQQLLQLMQSLVCFQFQTKLICTANQNHLSVARKDRLSKQMMEGHNDRTPSHSPHHHNTMVDKKGLQLFKNSKQNSNWVYQYHSPWKWCNVLTSGTDENYPCHIFLPFLHLCLLF